MQFYCCKRNHSPNYNPAKWNDPLALAGNKIINGWFISLPEHLPPPGNPEDMDFNMCPGGGDMDATFCPGSGDMCN